MEREAEERVLPLARERGVAVIINVHLAVAICSAVLARRNCPTGQRKLIASPGRIFPEVDRGQSDVTCAITATEMMNHLKDNLLGGVGRLPDAKWRQRWSPSREDVRRLCQAPNGTSGRVPPARRARSRARRRH